MALYHHTGDIVSSHFSPKNAFFFTKLMFGDIKLGLENDVIQTSKRTAQA